MAVFYESDYERNLWKNLVRDLIDKDLGMIFVTLFEKLPVGGLFLAYDKRCAYNLLSYFDKASNIRGIPSSLIWHSIKYASERNLEVYDFEGSVLPDIERFFQCFGGNHTPYFQVYWEADRSKMEPILFEY